MPKSQTQSRRVVGYVRISRGREKETSTTSQRESIEAHCKARGWTLVKVVEESGRSAFKASRKSRPAFREAMGLVTSGAADTFCVWKIDRACRNTRDLLDLVETLGEHSAEFASTTEQFDTTTPIGQAMLTIIGALAELESAQKSERATEWHAQRRKNRVVPAGPPALGYCKPAPNELAPDPVVAPLVEAAARSIVDGGSVSAAVRALNAEGVKVTHRGLSVALQSPTLAGLIAENGELLPGSWEAVLDRETWEAARAVLSAPSRSTTTGNKLRHALAPIARCHCGSPMHVHMDKWRTKSGVSQMLRLLCADTTCATGIGYDALEEAVAAAVLDLLDGGTWDALRSAGTAEPSAAEARLTRMWEMVLDGLIEPEEYAEAKARWVDEVAATDTATDLPDVGDVRAEWDDLTPQERHLIYRAAITSLTIAPATRRGGRGVDLGRVGLTLTG